MKLNKSIFLIFVMIAVMAVGVNAVNYTIAKTVSNFSYLDCNSSLISNQGYAILNSINDIGTSNQSINYTIEIITSFQKATTQYNTIMSKGHVDASATNNTEWTIRLSSAGYIDFKYSYLLKNITHPYNVSNDNLNYKHYIFTIKEVTNLSTNRTSVAYYINGDTVTGTGDNDTLYMNDFNNPIWFCNAINRYNANDLRYKYNGTVSSIKIYKNYVSTSVEATYIYKESKLKYDNDIHIINLAFHNVIPNLNSSNDALEMNVSDFNKTLNYFYKLGYESITFNQYYMWKFNNTFSMPKKAIIISFDDGLYGVIQNALPLMTNYGFTGVVAIPTNTISTSLTQTTYKDYMNYNDLNNLNNLGWEIASHSVTQNQSFINSTQTGRYSEYNNSKNTIYANTGIIPTTFVYPGNVQNAGNRSECLLFYIGCSGDSTYNHNQFPSYIYKSIDMTITGLERYTVGNYPVDITLLNSAFNKSTYNYVLDLDFDNITGIISDYSGKNNNNLSLINISLKTDGKTKPKLLTNNLNKTLVYLSNNLPPNITSINATYNDVKNLVNLSCSGTGNIVLNNMLSLGTKYQVYHNGIRLGESTTNTYTITSCSDWIFEGGEYITITSSSPCVVYSDTFSGSGYNVTYTTTTYHVEKVSTVASNTTGSFIENMSKIPAWLGIIVVVFFAFAVLGFFYGRENAWW